MVQLDAEREARQAAYMAQLAEEQRVEAERRAALPAVAGKIAETLGEGWAAADPHPDYPGCELLGPDGARLYFRPEGYREWKRYSIVGSYPDGTRDAYRAEHFSITVSCEKSPEKIAGDIARRLLSKYLPELAKAREAVARHQDREAAADALAAELAAIIGTEASGTSRRRSFSGPHRVPGFLRVEVRSGDSVNLDGSVPPEIARELMRLLADWRPVTES
jgi:hypothetical protein